MAPSPKKKTPPVNKSDVVAPDRLVVMRPLTFNRAANTAPDPKVAQQRAQALANTQALADAFSGYSEDDGSGIDMAAVERALKGGANINAAVNELGQTALHIAVNENNHVLAAQLLRAGANTRVRDHEGLTPLIIALREGDEGMSGMLARAEEKPEAQTLQGRHAIHDAAKAGHVEAIEALVARGASATIRDVDGDSPLMEALRHEAMESAFALAYAGGLQPGMLKKYKEAFDSSGSYMPDYDLDAFLKAALAAPPQTIKPQPVALPPKLGTREEELFRLIAERESDVADLLKKRPNLNAVNAAGDTPLIAALRRGMPCIAEKVSHKSDVSATGAFGRTALHHAASKATEDYRYMIGSLADMGAKIDAQDARGHTPLMLAVKAGAQDSVLILLEHGAKLDLKDKLGFTALDHAGFAGENDIIEILENEAADRKKAAKAKAAKPAFKTAARAPAKKPAAKKPLRKQAGRRYC